MAPRIPEDQPFIVGHSVRKRAVVFGGVSAALLLPLGGIFALLADPRNSVALLNCFIGIVLLFVALFGLQIWMLASGGPALAIGPVGLWIKTRPTRGQAIWLPWESVGMVSRRRLNLEKLLCVAPRDPRASQNLGAFTAVDAHRVASLFGTGFVATLNFADKSEAEILAAVAHYSAGRVLLK
jgi:hypothetical protein